jgi:thiosulfate/3-mercaptopyruvate sulfurtransferase
MHPLVSLSWLADHLHDSNLVVVDATLPPVGANPPVDTHARYLDRHIPGAVFFDIDTLSDRSTTLPHMLPSAADFSRQMGALGISDSAGIVIYEQTGVFSAPRAWWMLRTLGAREVHLLDGDLQAWIDAGFSTQSGETQHPPATFSAQLDPTAVRDFEDVQQLIAHHGQILDARSTGRFNGSAPEPRPRISSGHMPGAINIPFTELVRDGRLKPAHELRELFQTKGVNLDQPVTTSCGSGVTAAVLLLGLELAGAKNLTLYDGSWAEYAQRNDAIIETSPPA